MLVIHVRAMVVDIWLVISTRMTYLEQLSVNEIINHLSLSEEK